MPVCVTCVLQEVRRRVEQAAPALLMEAWRSWQQRSDLKILNAAVLSLIHLLLMNFQENWNKLDSEEPRKQRSCLKTCTGASPVGLNLLLSQHAGLFGLVSVPMTTGDTLTSNEDLSSQRRCPDQLPYNQPRGRKSNTG